VDDLTWLGVLVGIVVALVCVLVVWFLAARHWVTSQAARAGQSWRELEAQRVRRAELVPELLDAVRAYAAHETSAFDSVMTARAASVGATAPGAAATADGELQRALQRLIAIAEGYPQLQASEGFLRLQAELSDAADAVQTARRAYNGSLRELNTRCQTFPASLTAKRRGLAGGEFYEIAGASSITEGPRVQF